MDKYNGFIRDAKNATPLMMLLILVCLFLFVFFTLDLHTFDVTDNKEAVDFKWRLFWGLSIILLIISMLWSYTISSSMVHHYLSAQQNKKKIFVLIYIFLTIIAALVAFFPFDFGGAAGESLQEMIRKNTAIDISLITDVMNTLAAITVTLLVIGLSLLAINTEESEAAIQKKTLYIHRSLYSSSVLLAAGILEIFCLFRWPVALDPTQSHQVEVSSALIITAGLFYSLMLAIVYIPLFIKRNEALNRYMKKQKFTSKEELDNWYAINHMEKESGAGFNDVVAFILPIATGLLINVLSSRLA